MYEECKPGGLRHAWYDYDFDLDWKRYVELWLTSRCDRCGTLKAEGFDPAGNIVKRWYKHPEGYKDTEDTKPSANQIRLQRMKAKKVAQRRIRKTAAKKQPAKKATTRLRRVK